MRAVDGGGLAGRDDFEVLNGDRFAPGPAGRSGYGRTSVVIEKGMRDRLIEPPHVEVVAALLA